jgi:hypothetical protein
LQNLNYFPDLFILSPGSEVLSFVDGTISINTDAALDQLPPFGATQLLLKVNFCCFSQAKLLLQVNSGCFSWTAVVLQANSCCLRQTAVALGKQLLF